MNMQFSEKIHNAEYSWQLNRTIKIWWQKVTPKLQQRCSNFFFSDESPARLLWSALRTAYIKITIGVIHNTLNYGANFYIMYLKGAQILCQVAVATKLSMVTFNVCWSSVRKLFFLTILAPRIMRRLLDFWKTCAFLIYINYKCDRDVHHASRRPAD